MEVETCAAREVQTESSLPPSQQHSMASSRRTRTHRPSKRRKQTSASASTVLCALLALPSAMAQSCISLAGSSQCPSFNASSISTGSSLVGLFPFLSSVTDTASFDTQLEQYISNGFAQTRYAYFHESMRRS